MNRREKLNLIISIAVCIGILVLVIVTGGVHAEKPDAQADLLKRQQEEVTNEISTIDPIRTDSVSPAGSDMADTVRSDERPEEQEVDWGSFFLYDREHGGDSVPVHGVYRQEEVGTGVGCSDEGYELNEEDVDINDSGYSADSAMRDTNADDDITTINEADNGEDAVLADDHICDIAVGDTFADDHIADQDPDMTAPQTEADYGFTDDEVHEIARITYLETGCLCDYYTVYLTACVIINRYLDWGYNSISEVIYAPGQYATAYKYDDWGGGKLRINERTWQAVYDAIADTDRSPHYQMGKGYDHQIYYSDPDWDVCFYY